jgi:hypothetical protein
MAAAGDTTCWLAVSGPLVGGVTAAWREAVRPASTGTTAHTFKVRVGRVTPLRRATWPIGSGSTLRKPPDLRPS